MTIPVVRLAARPAKTARSRCGCRYGPGLHCDLVIGLLCRRSPASRASRLGGLSTFVVGLSPQASLRRRSFRECVLEHHADKKGPKPRPSPAFWSLRRPGPGASLPVNCFSLRRIAVISVLILLPLPRPCSRRGKLHCHGRTQLGAGASWVPRHRQGHVRGRHDVALRRFCDRALRLARPLHGLRFWHRFAMGATLIPLSYCR